MDFSERGEGTQKVFQSLGTDREVEGLTAEGNRALGITQDKARPGRILPCLLEVAGIEVDADRGGRQESRDQGCATSDVDGAALAFDVLEELDGLRAARAMKDRLETDESIGSPGPVVALAIAVVMLDLFFEGPSVRCDGSGLLAASRGSAGSLPTLRGARLIRAREKPKPTVEGSPTISSKMKGSRGDSGGRRLAATCLFATACAEAW